MAGTGDNGELATVAALLSQSQTKPLLIRGELDELLAEHPERPDQPGEPAEPDEAETRRAESPPAEQSRRVGLFVLCAGAAVALGLAAVVLLQPSEVPGSAVTTPTGPAAPAPVTAPSSDAVATISASSEPSTLTAGLDDTPVRTTGVPGAGRKPANPANPANPAPPEDPEQSWRDFVSSVESSFQNGHGNPPRH
jgi:hypothetical protein